MGSVTLVLGGAASGKSAWSERLIEGGFRSRWTGATYLATATPDDAEMAARIRRHRDRRGSAWTTIEEPLALADTLREYTDPARPILVDCLTLWLSNLIMAGRDPEAESRTLCEALANLPGPVLMVSNEIGHGIVPADAETRAFRDHAGRLNQVAAAAATRVYLITAGLPLTLKDEST